jgi:YhcH/YjgK/YiaL family protein
MVLDTIENAARYMHLGDGISKALLYIRQNDMTAIKPGRYEIENDRLVMLVFENNNPTTDTCKLEGHRRYIDLQYWVSGSELMGHEILKSQPLLEDYNEKADYAFYNCNASFSRLLPGMFVIYYPTDLHTAVTDPQSGPMVRKIVFKIHVDA